MSLKIQLLVICLKKVPNVQKKKLTVRVWISVLSIIYPPGRDLFHATSFS